MCAELQFAFICFCQHDDDADRCQQHIPKSKDDTETKSNTRIFVSKHQPHYQLSLIVIIVWYLALYFLLEIFAQKKKNLTKTYHCYKKCTLYTI